MRLSFTFVLVLAFALPSAYSQQGDSQAWTDSIYLDMSWEAKVGQLFMVPWRDEISALQMMENHYVGGFILPAGTFNSIESQVEFLNRNSKYPLWIAVESPDGINPGIQSDQILQEAGTLQSLSDKTLVDEIGFATGQLLRSLGVNFHIMPIHLPEYAAGMMRAGINVPYPISKAPEVATPIKDRPDVPLTYAETGIIRSNADEVLVALQLKQSVDMVVMGIDQISNLHDIHKAVFDNLKKREIKDIVKKVLLHKYQQHAQPKYIARKGENIFSRNHEILYYEILGKSFVYRPAQNTPLPIVELENQYFATLSGHGATGRVFREGIERYVGADHYFFESVANQFSKAEQYLPLYDWILIDLSQNQMLPNLWEVLNKLPLRCSIVVYFNGSKIPENLPDNVHIIWNNENVPLAYDLVSQAIFGAIPMEGIWPEGFGFTESATTAPIQRLRYAFPEIEGMNAKRLSKIDEIVSEAISKKAMPGAQVLVLRHGAVVYNKSFGYHTYDSVYPVSKESIYDIASLSKVAGTLQAIMYLVDKGQVNVNAALSVYFPELKGNPKGGIIIKDILAHQAGLPSYYPFWRNTFDKSKGLLPDFYAGEITDKYKKSVTAGLYTSESMEDSLWHWITGDQIKLKPSGKYLYSDIGFMMLKRLAEKELGKPMDAFLQEGFFRPLGMNHTSYTPLCDFPLDQIVPTEEDRMFRMSIVLGHVHDQNAAMIGGVAGHAGMFSTGNDLAKLMQMHLQEGYYGGKRYLAAPTSRSFTEKQKNSVNRRGLGWDKPAFGPANNVSDRCSPGTFGHTGFTGIAAWADPKEQLVFIFLSNRTYPNTNNNKLNELNIRTRIQDAIYAAIISGNEAGD